MDNKKEVDACVVCVCVCVCVKERESECVWMCLIEINFISVHISRTHLSILDQNL